MNIRAHIKSERASLVRLISSSIKDLLTVNVSSAGPSERKCLWSTQTSPVTEGKSCRKYPDDAASPAVHIAAQADGNKDVSETEHWVVHSAASLAEELKRSDRLFKKTTKVLEPHSTWNEIWSQVWSHRSPLALVFGSSIKKNCVGNDYTLVWLRKVSDHPLVCNKSSKTQISRDKTLSALTLMWVP